jgi:hypothetical protein
MSTREGWTINGRHFTKTSTERGGTRYFIDGMPTRRAVWFARYEAAKQQAAAKIVPDDVRSGSAAHLNALSTFFGI